MTTDRKSTSPLLPRWFVATAAGSVAVILASIIVLLIGVTTARADPQALQALQLAAQARSGNLTNLNAPIQPQNQYALVSTLTKIATMQAYATSQSGYTSPAQLRIFMTGDSTTQMHNAFIACELRRRYGDAGFIGAAINNAVTCGGSSPTVNSTSGTVTVVTGDYTRTPEGEYTNYASGACQVYGANGGYMVANLLAIEYVQEPGAGSLVISTNNNGAGFVQQATVSAAGTLSGQVWSMDMGSAAPYTIQVCASGGAVKVYQPGFVNTKINGVVLEMHGRGGLRIPDYTSTPSAITANWDAFENPDLVMFKMDTNGQSGTYPSCTWTSTDGTISGPFSQFWTLFATRFVGSAPLRDVVIDGGYATDDLCILPQNEVQRSWAQANKKRYFDGFNATGSLANEITLGWLTSGDHAHHTAVGQVAQAEIMMQDLGLNSLWTGALNNNTSNSSSTTSTLTIVADPTKVISALNPALAKWTYNSSDASLTLNRAYRIFDSSSVEFAHLEDANTSANFMPFFHLGAAANTGVCGNTTTVIASTGAGCSANARVNALTYQIGASTTNSASGNVGLNPGSGGLQVVNAVGAVTYKLGSGLNGGDLIASRFCQDATGGRTLTYDNTQYGGAIGASLTASICTLQQWVYTGSKIRSMSLPVDDNGGTYATTMRLTAQTFSTLTGQVTCNSGNEGTIAAITDSTTATWGATITGGGSNHVEGRCNGTNWTVVGA